MSNGFTELGISPPILKAIEEMGFEEPTEVQTRAIPHILKKEDLIVMSKTGSGKTAVFGVSMLQLTDPSMAGPQGLILTPTRELAVQVDNDLKLMSKHLQHKTTVVYGQHSMNVEIKDLKSGITIVTGTPGRVFDHIRHGNLQTRNIRFLVLDEADRMLDMGFLDQVVRIIKTVPRDRVTLLFSATIPAEIRRICSEYMKNPEMIEIESQTKTVDTISQVYYRVAHNEKNTQLSRLLLVEQPESCMIFCNTRIAVDRVQSFLTRKGYASEALHGDIPQGRRMKTIEQFKQGEFHLLVATDVAARGIHIDNLSLVINYDVPVEKDSYVHRIGRTGRAGNVGRSITLVTSEDIMSLYAIEEHIGAMIEEGELPSEEVLNNRKSAADSWLQANALKVRPSQSHTDSNENGSQRKRPYTKSAPHQADRRKERPAGTNPEQKSGSAGSSAPYTGRTRSTGNAQSAGQPKGPRTPYAGDRAPDSRPPYAGDRAASSRPPYTGDRTANPRTPYSNNRAPGSRPPYTGDRAANTRTPYAGNQPKPAQPVSKPVSAQPVETNAVQKESSSGKSFLQRILKRVFGK